MDIVNLDALERGMKVNLIDVGIAVVTLILAVLCLFQYKNSIYFIILFTGIIMICIVLGGFELYQWIRVRHDIQVVSESEERIRHKGGAVYCGDVRLLSFNTLRRCMVQGVYMDIQNKTILIARLVKEDSNE